MTTDLESILARLKPQKDMTLEMQSAANKLWYDWWGWCREGFAACLLDLVQRQDKENTELNEKYAQLESRCFDGVPTGSSVWGELDASIAREKRLREALGDAEQSLHTLATSAGKEEALLGETAQIRGYANSRATAAKAILEDKS